MVLVLAKERYKSWFVTYSIFRSFYKAGGADFLLEIYIIITNESGDHDI